jgi:hypothetical protein
MFRKNTDDIRCLNNSAGQKLLSQRTSTVKELTGSGGQLKKGCNGCNSNSKSNSKSKRHRGKESSVEPTPKMRVSSASINRGQLQTSSRSGSKTWWLHLAWE